MFCSAAISVIFFATLKTVGEYAIQYFVANTNYMEQEDNKKVVQLQTYISENHISARDAEQLTK